MHKFPFEIRADDRDYSGLTVVDSVLDGSDIEKSFFHGTVLSNCTFSEVKLNNTEFSEAAARSCRFHKVDLSGSDIIDSEFEGTKFSATTFEKGEWRESVFKNCRFQNCDFTHTTVALCRFVMCEFDEQTMARLENRSIYYNVFQNCRFSGNLSDASFCSRNFGVPSAGQMGTLVRTDTGLSLEQVCLLNNLGRLRTVDIVTVTENICNTLKKGGQRRTSTLHFLCNIVRMLTEEKRISASSLMCLEQIVVGLANTTVDQDLFKASMDAIVEFRNSLALIAAESREPSVRAHEGHVRSVSIFFPERYERQQIEVLKDALAETAGASRSSFTIARIEYGSTFIEIMIGGTVTVAGLLTALNYMLRQATITLKELGKLRKEIRATLKPTRLRNSSKAVTMEKESRVPAILKTGAVSESMIPVQIAVRINGKMLAEMDERAEVSLLIQ